MKPHRDWLEYCETPRQEEVLRSVLKHGSNSKAARELGINRRTVDRTIARIRDGMLEDYTDRFGFAPEVRVLDIETAPILAYLWSLFQNGTGHNMVAKDWYIISYAWKTLGASEIRSKSLDQTAGYKPGTENDRELAEDLHKVLEEADVVVAHNGDRFDLRRINTRMLLHGLRPPLPYRSVDTLKIAKRAFAFSSNKLDFISAILTGEGKLKTDFELWVQCLKGNPKAWQTMRSYNARDTLKLEEVYTAIRPWDKHHPSLPVLGGAEDAACSVCNSSAVHRTDKIWATHTGRFAIWLCGDCGHSMRERQNLRTSEAVRDTLLNVPVPA